jgi:hypothetical protein
MKLTKKHLKRLIKEEFSKKPKRPLLSLYESKEAMAAAMAEAKALGVRLWEAYDVWDGTDDPEAHAVLVQLKSWAAAGRWDLIKLTADGFNDKAKSEGESEDVIAQTRSEGPDEEDGDEAELIALFQKAETETVTRMAKTSERKRLGAEEFSPEVIEAKAMEKAKEYLSKFNLTPDALKTVGALAQKIGPDKLVQGLTAVLNSLN